MAFFKSAESAMGLFLTSNGIFEYRLSKGDVPIQGTWGLDNGFIHEIAMADGTIRFANVGDSIAIVCMDMHEDGSLQIESWDIKK